ncbi:MAG: tyrosine--tRNA ligase, partial [Chloroflexota bacterium]
MGTEETGSTAFDVLQERGFVYQCSDEVGLRKHLAAGPVTFYSGYDPTADSLHIGNLVGIMAMAHLQRGGQRPVARGGGGGA